MAALTGVSECVPMRSRAVWSVYGRSRVMSFRGTSTAAGRVRREGHRSVDDHSYPVVGHDRPSVLEYEYEYSGVC